MSALNYFNQRELSKASLVGIVLASLALVISAVLIWYYSFCQTHLPPRTTINGLDVGGMTYEEAKQNLQLSNQQPPAHTLTLSVDDIVVASQSGELGSSYDFSRLLDSIEQTTHDGSLSTQLNCLLSSLFKPASYLASATYDEAALDAMIAELNKLVSYGGTTPQATLEISGNPESITIIPGSFGREIDRDETKKKVFAQLKAGNTDVVAAVASTSGVLSTEEIENSKIRANKLVGKKAEFKHETKNFVLNDEEMIKALNLPAGYNLPRIQTIIALWSEEIDRPPQEPELVYDQNTLQATSFTPPRDGLVLNKTTTEEQILQTLKSLETDEGFAMSSDQATTNQEQNNEQASESDNNQVVELKVVATPPNKSLADTNNLGINERIGFGDSHYDHSIANRIHNVSLTTGRVNLIIIPPGKEFRFNDALGPVSAETGFKSAYVIRNGQTELGDGGGVCQVSTTLFRAVLNAGLDVTLRLPHSYRVSYYELDRKPGVDATVYAGNTDFRFKNDTAHHILLYGEADSKNLYMFYEIYGTSDGRTAEIVDHKTWNYKPPLPPEYIDDPSLPAGQVKQVDWAAAGISASFTNVIKDKDGNIINEDTYVSHYKPWAAKYLRGVN